MTLREERREALHGIQLPHVLAIGSFAVTSGQPHFVREYLAGMEGTCQPNPSMHLAHHNLKSACLDRSSLLATWAGGC